ncbi:MAG: 50S ribosomal protein L32 [Bacilli bacterium]|jgi:large subunit ribosomal protein L32
MAVQQRRTSKTRKRLRRTHFKLEVTGLTTCPNCGTLIRAHHVCPKCHYYGGKDVITKEAPKAAKSKAKK